MAEIRNPNQPGGGGQDSRTLLIFSIVFVLIFLGLQYFGPKKKTQPETPAEVASTSGAKAAMYRKLKEQKREGIVLKLHTAPYMPGRPNSGGHQLKLKFCATASCIVAGANGSKRSVALELFDSGSRIGIGNVTIPANHKIPVSGDVVEVRYLYAYPGGSLYQPVYLGERDDIEPAACTIKHLKFKAAEEEN